MTFVDLEIVRIIFPSLMGHREEQWGRVISRELLHELSISVEIELPAIEILLIVNMIGGVSYPCR